MARQLPLNLPSRPALGRGDFFVTEANALAVAQIDHWRAWPSGKLVLSGPRGSGKTHLAHVWSAESGARILEAAELTEEAVPDLVDGPICVEDADRIAGDRAQEEVLFHLHNLARAEGQPLMVTASRPPARWGLCLPDLASRMQGAEIAKLNAPDELLLAGVIAKLFADRQITPAPTVIPYLLTHMPRSFAAAGAIVDAMDARALGEKRGVTRALAIDLIREFSDSEESFEAGLSSE
ncbi:MULTISPECIES: P-loop NTPase family protein [unclassified Roseivivax]|uniref:chromosomal replication initiator DnaA n=1 Tax=Roseivivax sp. GX 12232 TaxID=2900547 RepID=UPI001E3F6430|nr:chromosomal replication initiator DnaA [Roseivivax sp. GX 12232]MCE0504922.1 chromosomal replication initiator DnaA [Roseivivax sp. GX 12232]